jgi:CRP-like cAMP-binding protein
MQTLSGTSLIDQFGMEYFQAASVFGAVSPTAIAFLLDRGRVLELERGEVVYKPGDKGDRFYVILGGSLSFYQFYRDEFAYIRDHAFGEEMGFVAMIALHDRIGKAVAAEHTYLLEISCSLFYELRKEFPADFGLFLLNLSREMARTIREVSNIIVENEIAKRGVSRTAEASLPSAVHDSNYSDLADDQ